MIANLPLNGSKKVFKGRKKERVGQTHAVVTQFYQTKLCKHFQNGSCLYGDECTLTRLRIAVYVLGSFSHSADGIRERPNLTKTKLCPSVENGGICEAGSAARCPYAHNLSELRATPMLFRTVMCSWWKKGQCEFGDNCRFAHGEDELRESSQASCSPRNSPLSRNSGAIFTPVNPPPVLSSVQYPVVLAAALAAASQAAAQNGVSVLSAQQTMAIASAASAAALEAISLHPPPTEPPKNYLPYSYPASSAGSPPTMPTSESIIRDQLNTLRKGFSSSPALLSFFDEEGEIVGGRPRADSDPVLKLTTETFLEELRKLWVDESEVEPVVGVPLMRSDPFLSASHMTLDSYQINND